MSELLHNVEFIVRGLLFAAYFGCAAVGFFMTPSFVAAAPGKVKLIALPLGIATIFMLGGIPMVYRYLLP